MLPPQAAERAGRRYADGEFDLSRPAPAARPAGRDRPLLRAPGPPLRRGGQPDVGRHRPLPAPEQPALAGRLRLGAAGRRRARPRPASGPGSPPSTCRRPRCGSARAAWLAADRPGRRPEGRRRRRCCGLPAAGQLGLRRARVRPGLRLRRLLRAVLDGPDGPALPAALPGSDRDDRCWQPRLRVRRRTAGPARRPVAAPGSAGCCGWSALVGVLLGGLLLRAAAARRRACGPWPARMLAALGVRLALARPGAAAGQPAGRQPRLLAGHRRAAGGRAGRLVAKREVRGWPGIGVLAAARRRDLRGPLPAEGAAGDGGRGGRGAAGRSVGRGLPGGYDLLRRRAGPVPAGDVPGGGGRRRAGGAGRDPATTDRGRVRRRRHPVVLGAPGGRAARADGDPGRRAGAAPGAGADRRVLARAAQASRRRQPGRAAASPPRGSHRKLSATVQRKCSELGERWGPWPTQTQPKQSEAKLLVVEDDAEHPRAALRQPALRRVRREHRDQRQRRRQRGQERRLPTSSSST